MAGLLDFEELQQNPLRLGLLMAGLNMLGGKNGVQDGAQGFAQGLLQAGEYQKLARQEKRQRQADELQMRQFERQMQNDSLDQQYKRLQMDKLQNPQNFVDPYNTVVETSQGLYSFNNRNGQLTPLMDGNNQPLMRSTSDPFQQAQITAAKEGQKGVEVTDADRRKFRTTQHLANPGAFPDLINNPFLRQQQVESNFNPNAVSPKGAVGPMQIMPGTALDPGYGIAPAKDNSIRENLRLGYEYQMALMQKRLDEGYNEQDAYRLALQDYNAGRGNVDKNPEIGRGYAEKVIGEPIKSMSAAEESAINVKEAALKEQNKATIENQAKQQQSHMERQQQGARMYDMLTQPVDGMPIETLIQQSTGSQAGALRDSLGRVIGQSTEGGKALSKLQTLSGWLTSNVPRMQGPQSDKDVMMYRQMAGNLADPTLTADEKLSSYRVILDIAKRQALSGNPAFVDFAPNSVAQPNTPPPTSQGNSMSTDDLIKFYLGQ